MPNDLRIQIVVDAAQVTAGMNGVTTSIDAATARIKAAFGSVEKAPEGIRNALMILENQSKMSGEAVALATAAIAELGGTASTAAPQVASVGAAAGSAATQLTGMDRAMAMATGRLAGFTVGAGMLGGALGRVGAASSTLGPLLAAAFPVFAVVIAVDLIDKLLDKLEELAEQPYKVRIAFTELDIAMDKSLQGAQNQLDKLQTKFLTLTQGPLAGMRFELEHINQSFDNVESAANHAFSTIQKGLKEADMSRWNPVGWLASIEGVDVGVKDLKPLADKINLSLQEALLSKDPAKIQQALTSGITELARKQQETETGAYLAEVQHDSVLTERYQQRMLAIKSMIAALQDMKALEKDDQKKTDVEADVKKAEIAKELEKEHEKATAQAEAYAKWQERAKLETITLADRVKALADAQAEFGNKAGAKDAGGEAKDLAERQAAERQFQEESIAREKQTALSELDIQEDQVKELARLGKIGADEEARQLNALEEQKLQIEKAYLQNRINTILARLNSDDDKAYAEDLKEWGKLLTDKQKAEDTYQKNRQKNLNTAATAENQIWSRVAEGMTRLFDQAIQGIVSGTERFGTAFARIIDGMLAKFIEALLQMAEQWVITHVFMVAVKKSAQQEEVLSDAKAAAASAWKAVVGIPIIGPVLAPIAAATAFAGVEAFSAEGGMDFVPADDTLALLHQREMVLPANIADSIRGMTSVASQGGASAGASTSGPQITVNYNGDFSAIDSKGMEDAFAKNSASLAKVIRRELRRTNAV